MTQTANKGDALIIWEDPYISANNMGEFIRQVPAKQKENIWSRHSNDGYIAECNLVQTLHSFTTLCLKMQQIPSTPPSRHEMEDKLKPLCDLIVQNIEDHDHGINVDEYNTKLHEWILDTHSPSNKLDQFPSTKSSKSHGRRRRKPPKSAKMAKMGKSRKTEKMSAPEPATESISNRNVGNVAPTTHSKRKLKGQRLDGLNGGDVPSGNPNLMTSSSLDHIDDSMVSSKPRHRSHSNAPRSGTPHRSRKRKPKPVRSKKLKLKRERSESAAPTLSNVSSSPSTSSVLKSYTSTASSVGALKPLKLKQSVSVNSPPK